jgi:hypothetical protein
LLITPTILSSTIPKGIISFVIIRKYGLYLSIDTISPKIIPLNISNGANLAGNSKIQFKISDNLSGVDSFSALLDGRWVLMEYDSKTGSLWHRFDERIVKGKHDFQLIVSDKKNNTTMFHASFYK